MTYAKMWFSPQDNCWYVPVASAEIAEQLMQGIEPVRLEIRDQQLVITKLETYDKYLRIVQAAFGKGSSDEVALTEIREIIGEDGDT